MPSNHMSLPSTINTEPQKLTVPFRNTGSAAAADKPTCPPIARTGVRSTGTTSVAGAMFTKFAAARRPGIVDEEERRDWW